MRGIIAKMNVYKSTLFEISLEDAWLGEQEEYCHTFYHPQGAGAFQISAYTANSDVDDEDLIAQTKFDREHLSKNIWGDFEGYQVVYSDGELFWRKWWLKHNNVLIFVTYNCDLSDQESELKVVNNMLSSLRSSQEN